MGTHSSPVDSANKYLRLSGGYRFYQFTALPCNMATVPLQFTKVAKEVKLMARAEGISIRQYIDGWQMRTNSKQQCQDITLWFGASCRSLGWITNCKRSVLFPTPVINLLLQFDLRVGLVFSIQRKLIERQLPCWKFSLISREAQVTLKAWF